MIVLPHSPSDPTLRIAATITAACKCRRAVGKQLCLSVGHSVRLGYLFESVSLIIARNQYRAIGTTRGSGSVEESLFLAGIGDSADVATFAREVEGDDRVLAALENHRSCASIFEEYALRLPDLDDLGVKMSVADGFGVPWRDRDISWRRIETPQDQRHSGQEAKALQGDEVLLQKIFETSFVSGFHRIHADDRFRAQLMIPRVMKSIPNRHRR